MALEGSALLDDAAALPVEAPGSRWLILAATSRGDAERFARERGLEDALVVDRHDVAGTRGRLRPVIRAGAVDHICLHTHDWKRQSMPQFYLAALALTGAPEVTVADESAGMTVWSRRAIRAAALRIPLELAQGLASVGLETGRLGISARRNRKPPHSLVRNPRAVLAVWLGFPESPVGGSVTHIAGILSGFRDAGLKIGLVSAIKSPPQLEAVVDDLELLEPLSPGQRMLRQSEFVCRNPPVRRAISRLAARLGPSLIYQRHEPFLAAGLDAAVDLDVPFVLEWNASEVWVLKNWSRWPVSLQKASTRLLAAVERHVATRASMVTPVSDAAGEAALEIGVDPSVIRTVPNAVDIEEADRGLASRSPDSEIRSPTVGWIGSFGEWHGAEVLIRALPRMDSSVRALMIGEGPERVQCQQLASDLGVSQRVMWRGQVPHIEALALLSSCDVLASPHVPLPGDTPFFGSPTKIFEYMALGRPIVASRLGQIGEVLDDGRTALLVTPGEPDELAERISDLLRAPDLGEALARSAREEAESRHRWRGRVETILQGLGS
jgi:glycosyltransferase involved in cell wall biosynthesis